MSLAFFFMIHFFNIIYLLMNIFNGIQNNIIFFFFLCSEKAGGKNIEISHSKTHYITTNIYLMYFSI